MMIDTPEGIAAYRMLALRSMLKLEILGMKHSRGSAYATIKRVFNLKGNKQRVLDQYETLLREKGILRA
jgi:hypothetical protein